MTWEQLVSKTNLTVSFNIEAQQQLTWEELLLQYVTERYLLVTTAAAAAGLAGFRKLRNNKKHERFWGLSMSAVYMYCIATVIIFGTVLLKQMDLVRNLLLSFSMDSEIPSHFNSSSESQDADFSSQLNLWQTVCLTVTPVVLLKVIWTLLQISAKAYQNRKALAQFEGPPRHWLYGSLHLLPKGQPLGQILKWAEEFGGKFLIYHGPVQPQVVVADPESIKTIFTSSEPKDRGIYRMLRPWLGDGLLLSSGKKWLRNRRLLTPAFHYNILRPYQNIFSTCANTLAEKWKVKLQGQEATEEMFENISLLTLDSLMRCIFGVESHFQTEEEPNPYIKAVNEVSDLTISRARFIPHRNDFLFNLSPSGFKYRRALHILHSFSSRVISERKHLKMSAHVKGAQSGKYKDFLDMLLECRDTEGHGLSNQEIRDEVDTFMFEGHDTTASGISWCLYNLACHPDIQEKCRCEVKDILGEQSEVSWDDLQAFTYLTMCVKESLRIKPPVAVTGRLVTKPITFPDGKTVPPGTFIGANIYAVHHNPSVWPDPEEFDPERFTYENSKDRHPYAYVPFSAGPRNCIGQHFALNELKTVLALLLKNFEFSLDETQLPEAQLHLVLRAKAPGLNLRVRPLDI